MAVRWSNELRFYVGGFDLSTANVRASITLMAPSLDKTVFSDAAESQIADIRRDEIEWAGWFEDGSQGIDKLLGTLIGTKGDVASFLIGTATGSRAYSGQILVQSVKPQARIGELVRVEANYKPDTIMDACRHFGPLKTVTAPTQYPSTGVDDSASSTGTHRVYYHLTRYTTGSFEVSLQDSPTAIAGSFANVGTVMVFTSTGSTANSFTGNLRRFVRVQIAFAGGASGSTDIFVTYRRGTEG